MKIYIALFSDERHNHTFYLFLRRGLQPPKHYSGKRSNVLILSSYRNDLIGIVEEYKPDICCSKLICNDYVPFTQNSVT